MVSEEKFSHEIIEIIPYMKRTHHNLVLFGYKACGKTYFGKLLSEELGSTFIDTDNLIEEQFEKKYREKLTCRQITQKIGEKEFRKLEKFALYSLEQRNNMIISVGGGAVLDPYNCDKLKEIGKMVYLEISKDHLRQRIFNEGIPSFLDPKNPEISFEKMYNERKPIYEKIGVHKVNLQEKNDQQVLNELKAIAMKK